MFKGQTNDSLFLLKRILQELVRPYYKKLIISVLLMILVAIASSSNVYLIKPAIDDVFLKQDRKMLLLLPIFVILIAIIKATASYFQNYFMRYIGQRIISEMQMKLYKHLLYADVSLIFAQSSGNIISRFTNDILIMRGAVSNLIIGFAQELLTVIFLLILMFSQDFTLTIVAFVAFPLAIIPLVKTGRRMRKISAKTQEELGNYTAKLDDSFQSIRTIKSYNREEFEINKANNITEKIFDLYVKSIKISAISSPIMEMLGAIAIALVILYGGMQVINGQTTTGGFFSFMTALIAAYKPIKSLSALNNNLQEGLAAAKRVFYILDIQPMIKDKVNAFELEVKAGDIKIHDVQLTYPNGCNALENISLNIPAGQMVALVGPSGGGKSTIINAILRFYQLSKGSIAIDGQKIEDVTMKSLRDNISLVSQDINLFDDTILANIAYGKLEASKEEIIEAAKNSSAHEFILLLPNGYETIIGPNGINLSGGQRQRLAIARAMLKNSPILLLDEATSSLDTISEDQIQKSLEKLRQNRTTLVIAHRLSTIINASLIYVIKEGKVIASGTHFQLLKNCTEYAKLYNKNIIS